MSCKKCLFAEACSMNDFGDKCSKFKSKEEGDPADLFYQTIKWHKVVKRPMTPEEREEFGEAEYFLDCVMPEDGQEILVATKFGTDTDISCYDGGYYLEGRGSWDDVIAWTEIPKYMGEG